MVRLLVKKKRIWLGPTQSRLKVLYLCEVRMEMAIQRCKQEVGSR